MIRYIKLTHCQTEAEIFLAIEFDESVTITESDILDAVEAASPIEYDETYWSPEDFVVDTENLYNIIEEPL